MNGPSVSQLIPILQTAIGPMILISGVGLLVLTMTNRLGRAIDPRQLVTQAMPAAGVETHTVLENQLRVLWHRARLLRAAIALVAASALAAALLIIVLFLTALWGLQVAWLISTLFVICMLCLIASLVVFIEDINKSLAALKLELQAVGLRDV